MVNFWQIKWLCTLRMQFPLLQVTVTRIFLVSPWKTLFEFAWERKSGATDASKSLLSVKRRGTDQKSRLRVGRHQSKARRVRVGSRSELHCCKLWSKRHQRRPKAKCKRVPVGEMMPLMMALMLCGDEIYWPRCCIGDQPAAFLVDALATLDYTPWQETFHYRNLCRRMHDYLMKW